jgi:hypothetical protein
MECLGCQDLGWTISEENPKPAAEVGQRAYAIVCIGSAENSMSFSRRNWRGNFGSVMRVRASLQQD